jgi:hypothetical protein
MKTSKNVAYDHICGYIMLQVRWLNLLPHLCFNIWRKQKVYTIFLAIWKHHLTMCLHLERYCKRMKKWRGWSHMIITSWCKKSCIYACDLMAKVVLGWPWFDYHEFSKSCVQKLWTHWQWGTLNMMWL